MCRGGILVLFGSFRLREDDCVACGCGLERAQGFVRIGRSIWQDDAKEIFVPTYERSLGYVFQEASLFEHLNVEKNLRFGLVRTKDADGEARLAEAIELLGIGELLKRRVDELSGGASALRYRALALPQARRTAHGRATFRA